MTKMGSKDKEGIMGGRELEGLGFEGLGLRFRRGERGEASRGSLRGQASKPRERKRERERERE
jgi:hypothetical protein